MALPIFVPYVNQGSSSHRVGPVHNLTAVHFVLVLCSSSDDTFVRIEQFTDVITRYKKCKQYVFKIDFEPEDGLAYVETCCSDKQTRI